MFNPIEIIDDKIGVYSGYVSCYSCIEDIVFTLKNLKDNLCENVNSYANTVIHGISETNLTSLYKYQDIFIAL